MKNRGLKAIDIVVMNGAKGISQTAKQHFPNRRIQNIIYIVMKSRIELNNFFVRKVNKIKAYLELKK